MKDAVHEINTFTRLRLYFRLNILTMDKTASLLYVNSHSISVSNQYNVFETERR